MLLHVCFTRSPVLVLWFILVSFFPSCHKLLCPKRHSCIFHPFQRHMRVSSCCQWCIRCIWKFTVEQVPFLKPSTRFVPRDRVITCIVCYYQLPRNGAYVYYSISKCLLGSWIVLMGCLGGEVWLVKVRDSSGVLPFSLKHLRWMLRHWKHRRKEVSWNSIRQQNPVWNKRCLWPDTELNL